MKEILKFNQFISESRMGGDYPVFGVSDWKDIKEEILDMAKYYSYKGYSIKSSNENASFSYGHKEKINFEIVKNKNSDYVIGMIQAMYNPKDRDMINLIINYFPDEDVMTHKAGDRIEVTIPIKKGSRVNDFFYMTFGRFEKYGKRFFK